MRSTAPLGVLLLLSACAGSPSAPAPGEPPPPPRTWLGQVARADLPQAAGMAVPLYAHAQAAIAGAREAARIEAGAPALPILRATPAAAAWSPRAWRMIALLHEGNPEAGAILAAQVADAMAGLAALRQAIPGTDADRVAGERWHVPGLAALAAGRARTSEAGRRWADVLPQATAATPTVPAEIERLRRIDLAETERRQRILLLAIAGVAPPEAAPAGDAPAATPNTPLPDAPPADLPSPVVGTQSASPAALPIRRTPLLPGAQPAPAEGSRSAPSPNSPVPPRPEPARPAASEPPALRPAPAARPEASAPPQERPMETGPREGREEAARPLQGLTLGGTRDVLAPVGGISRPNPKPWDLPWAEQILQTTPMSIPGRSGSTP